MSDYCIDSFEYKEDLWDLELKYVNILYYVKEEYGIRVQDLANTFSTTRQTINNYFKKSTDDLPMKVKNKIANIYKCNSFKEVLSKEYEVINGNYNILPILNDSISNQDGIIEVDEDIPGEYLRLYELRQKHSSGYILKEIYDYGILWYKAVRGYSSTNDQQEGRNDVEMSSFLQKHSKEYAKLLMMYLSKVDEDDFQFMNTINKYFKDK